MKRSEIDAALDELYARVPKMIGCDGRCWVSCGPLEMSDRERARIREAGYKITPAAEAMLQSATFWCEALTEDRQCAVYKLRPLICRIWGAAESMQCPYGCVPEGGFLTDAEVAGLIAEAERIGGGGLPIGQLPEAAAAASVAAAFGKAGIGLRLQHNLPAAFRPKTEEFPCLSCGFMLTRPQGDDRYGRCGHCSHVIDLEKVTDVPAPAPAPAGRGKSRRGRPGSIAALRSEIARLDALRDEIKEVLNTDGRQD